MMKKPSAQLAKFSGLSMAALLALTACAEDSEAPADDATAGDEDADEDGDEDAAADADPIVLGFIPGWTDGLSTTYVWQEILENEGYEVELEEINDAGPLFAGVANGDIDVFPSAWLDVTHGSFMEENEGDLEDLGAYYEGAVLTLAVPSYTDIDTIEDLADNPEMFDGEIIGIESGAGHTEVTEGTVMPEYGLDDDFELLTSSTPAMLAELESALDAEEDIVVTLWRPFWAYETYDVVDLDDPLEALGEPETLNLVANSEFSSEYPEVADWMREFSLSDEEYGDLEDLMVNDYEGDEEEGAEIWVEENQDLLDFINN